MKPIHAFIIGAQKAGTSSLKSYLAQHPAIGAHVSTEMSYFLKAEEYAQPYAEVLPSYFDAANLGKDVLLLKNVGLMYDEAAIARVQAHNPAARLMVMLRQPSDRAYSAFWYARRIGIEPIEDFGAALDAGLDRFETPHARANGDYLGRSDYAAHLGMVLRYFPKAQVRVYLLEQFVADPQGTLDDMARFVGASGGFRFDTSTQHNRSAKSKNQKLTNFLKRPPAALKNMASFFVPKVLVRRWRKRLIALNEVQQKNPKMPAALRERLDAGFAPTYDFLAKEFGLDLSCWK